MSRGVELLGQVIDSLAPNNVDPSSVTVTGEGKDVGIVLIPHQDLGGYALVLWLDDQQAALGWAGVGDLTSHDDIDLAQWVVRYKHPEHRDAEMLHAALRAEFDRSIRVTLRRTRLRRRWQLWCAIQTSRGWREAYACDVPALTSPASQRVVDAGTTSLVGPDRPSTRQPPPVNDWHRWADPAFSIRAEE
jgi:hypothetical protein